MLEWLKRHAWKACGLLKGLASSNLALSAKMALQVHCRAVFLYGSLRTKKEPADSADSHTNNK